MLLFALSLAHAGDLVATLDGKPYVVATALAKVDPARPWMWGALISDGAFTCEDLDSGKANRSVSSSTTSKGGKIVTKNTVTGPTADTRLVVMFADSTPGTSAAFVLASGKGARDITLKRSELRIAEAPTDTSIALAVDIEGGDLALKGTLPVTLCGKLGARPAVSWTGAPQAMTLQTAALDPSAPAPSLPITLAAPEGWTYEAADRASFRFDPRWTAPDGMTALSIALETPPSSFADEARSRGEGAIEAWKAAGVTSSRSEALGSGAWVLELHGPAQAAAEVFRYEPGWAWQVHCSIVSDATGADAVFAQGIAACAAITSP